MKSIRWRLVIIYLALVFIVMIISGTFIRMRLESTEKEKAYEELKQYALFIEQQVINQYDNPDSFQNGVLNLMVVNSSQRSIQGSILNKFGETIASTTTTEKSQFREYKSSDIITALSGTESFSSNVREVDVNSQVKQWMSYAYPVFDEEGSVNYVVYVQLDASSINNNLKEVTRTIVFSVILALVLTCFLGLLFSNTITSPISLLTKKANLLAKGRLDQHISVKSNDEIGQLTRSFNYMARELRKTLSNMENENNKLEILLHNMTDGVLAFDEKGNLIHANQVCNELIDIDDRKINFQWFLDKIGVSKEEITPNLVTEKTINEKGKYISASLTPYGNNKIEGVVVVLQDITKHKQLDDMRKDFVANVSHEIRTPLTTIKSYSETLAEGAIDDRETAIEFLKIIDGAADRMTLLAKDLLELSRLDTKKVAFNFEDVNLVSLIDDCVKQNVIIANKKNQSITFEEPVNKELFISADYGRITQVVNNIISNSIKYSGENAKIEIKIEETKNSFYVYIKDNGMGIPKEDLSRIFERFYRVDKARSRAMGGNGLGLAISKEIMEGHGGDIQAFSSLGRGTTMVLIFPKIKKS